MGRTIILTGANSSAGIYTSEHILKTYPDLIVILLVRNSSPADLNTNSLRKVIAQYPNAKATIEELDLADLNSVRSFARSISASIRNGQYPPLKAIICNAFYWNLVAEPELTNDGFDRTMQVNFVANVALVLPLLESFNSHGGRIVLVSSVAHYRRKNPMTPYIPDIPEYLDELVHPPVDANVQAHGMLRYCNSKLVLTTWCYALNARLEKVCKTWSLLTSVTRIRVDVQCKTQDLADKRVSTDANELLTQKPYLGPKIPPHHGRSRQSWRLSRLPRISHQHTLPTSSPSSVCHGASQSFTSSLV
jgi:NAD(P)-dependent dehydrogenase (short-subunit alcohol dehydrogenase family)